MKRFFKKKYLLFLIAILWSVNDTLGQTMVYEEGGVSLSYKITKASSFKCKSNNRTLGYYYITVYLKNYSGKEITVNWATVSLNGDFLNPNFDTPCEQELPVPRNSGSVSASTSALTWWPTGSTKIENSIGSWYYNDKVEPSLTDWSIAPFAIKNNNTSPNTKTSPTQNNKVSNPTTKAPNQKVTSVPQSIKTRYYIESGQLVIDNGDTRELILISKMTPTEVRYYENLSGIKLSSTSSISENKKVIQQNKQNDEEEQNKQKQNAKIEENRIEEERTQQLRNEFEQTQIRMQNEQQEIENAGNSALLSVQNSIAQGKKPSGALIDGAIASASEISDLDSRRTYLGVMGAAALLSFFGEKRQEKLEKEQQVKREKQQIEREQKRLQDIANMQANYYLKIPIGQSLSKASLSSSDTVWGYFIAYPKNFIPGEGFEILMSNPFKIGKYSDETWPLLTDLTKKIDKKLIADKVGTNWVIKVRCFFKNEIETYTDMLTIQSDTYKIDGKVIAIDFTLNNVDQNNFKKAKSFWDEN